MIRSARISGDQKYRYELSRIWSDRLPVLCTIMLNPSTASEYADDATIRRLIGFCMRFGFGGFVVVNLFAFRATKPAEMLRAADPIGPENNAAIVEALLRCKKVLCAWGSNAAGTQRERDVRDLLRVCGVDTYALRVNRDGTPAHPLMLPYTCVLERFAP